MEAAIGQKFGVDPSLFKCTELKRADAQLLVDEQVVAMVAPPEPWPKTDLTAKDPSRIKCWSPEEAKQRFLERFFSITEEGSVSNPAFAQRTLGSHLLEQQALLNFTACFSRFEFAAKAQSLVYDLGENRQIDLKICWRKVAEKTAAMFSEMIDSNAQLKEAVEYFRCFPPKKQVLKAQGPKFVATADQNVCETEIILLALARVRNNLFHGGKGFSRDDIARDQQLVNYGLVILENLVESDDDLRRHYFG